MIITHHPFILSVCCRCSVVYAFKLTVPRMDGKLSHGFCVPCAVKELAKLKAVAA